MTITPQKEDTGTRVLLELDLYIRPRMLSTISNNTQHTSTIFPTIQLSTNEMYKCSRLGCSFATQSSQSLYNHQRYHRSHPFICPYPACQVIKGGKYNFDNLAQLHEHSERWQHALSYVMSFNTRDILQGNDPAASMGPHQPRRGHGMPVPPNDPAYTPGDRYPTHYERQLRKANEDAYRKANPLRLAAPPPNALMIPKQEAPVHGVPAGHAAYYMPLPSTSAAVSARPHALPKLEYDPEQERRLLRK